ncbi:MAG: phosphotransferase enzyme family protein [Armatimonadota bacterium]
MLEGFDPGVPEQFPDLGTCIALERLAGGHINDTFVGTYAHEGATRKVIHQQINHAVFRDVPGVMANIVRVTTHAAAWFREHGVLEPDRRVQGIHRTGDGATYWKSPQGNYWRTQDYISRAVSHVVAPTADLAYEAAFAFGLFQRVLADLDGERLVETIPGFHNTPRRYRAFLAAVDEDRVGRLSGCRAEVDLIRRHETWLGGLQEAWDRGTLRERIVHNDAKVANVLFDRDTGEGLAVIDLDTVMPGLAAHDFGDLVRSSTCRAAEDEPDPSKVAVDIALFEAIANGFIMGAGEVLDRDETASLLHGAETIVLEQAIRFLTDHLNGDTYFRIHRTNHNLDRARTQIALLGSILDAEPLLNGIVERAAKQ